MERKTILIVEDEASIAEVLALYLKRADFRTTHAADGMTARAMLEKAVPDLIILDVMLPGMDGFTLTRWIRERSNVPIILLTARREELDRISGSGDGRRRLRGQALQPAGGGEPGARRAAPRRQHGGEPGMAAQRHVGRPDR